MANWQLSMLTQHSSEIGRYGRGIRFKEDWDGLFFVGWGGRDFFVPHFSPTWQANISAAPKRYSYNTQQTY